MLAVALMSLSSTYAPMFQAAARTKTPLLLLGQAVCPANASTPQMNPLRLLRRQHVGSQHCRLLAGPAGQGSGRQNKDKLKLALVAMDIPISRQGIDNMEKLAGEMKIEVVDKQSVPPGRRRCRAARPRASSPTTPTT